MGNNQGMEVLGLLTERLAVARIGLVLGDRLGQLEFRDGALCRCARHHALDVRCSPLP